MFNLTHPKLVTLAETEGYADVADFLEHHALDSVVPAISMAPDCDHTADPNRISAPALVRPVAAVPWNPASSSPV